MQGEIEYYERKAQLLGELVTEVDQEIGTLSPDQQDQMLATLTFSRGKSWR